MTNQLLKEKRYRRYVHPNSTFFNTYPRIIWTGCGKTEIKPLDEYGISHDVSYSLNRRKRWKLEKEIPQYLQSASPEKDSNNTSILFVKLDPLHAPKSLQCQIFNGNGTGPLTVYRRGADAKSILSQYKCDAGEDKEEENARQSKSNQERNRTRQRRNVTTGRSNRNHQRAVSKSGDWMCIIVEPKACVDKRFYYRMFPRWWDTAFITDLIKERQREKRILKHQKYWQYALWEEVWKDFTPDQLDADDDEG
ncbi:unnamed protein product [Echinostoma caproni]|uniref:Uncharacterized protein n=1 Tax=Echinostoma caproni TaxID=27848 RepID=A0A183BCE6_9TREM|nr:unnamed protein product [Echinostoma caproni]